MTAQLVMDALLNAMFPRGRPRAVRHYVDQGAQYTSENFQRLVESHGVVGSMSRRGNCWDNAAIESFLSTMKTKRFSKKHYWTRGRLRADVFDYIERFYNPRQPYSTIGYISPIQFENLNAPNGSVRDDGGRPISRITAQAPTVFGGEKISLSPTLFRP